MKRRTYCLLVAVLTMLAAGVLDIQAQGLPASPQGKEIAVTFDDLPLNGPRVELKRLQTMTDKLLAGISQAQMPVVAFINESLVYINGETEARIAILQAWSAAGAELGNHTFSHVNFKNSSLSDYEDDFIRGDTLTRILLKPRGQKPRYFRHPFLQMGKTQELEKSFESFIAERGYRIAPVTIDTMDWMFLAAYAKARQEGDAAMLKQVSEQYLKFAEQKFAFAEKVATELFAQPIKHILLLHANELNADNFAELVKMIQDRGYRFITLEQALQDPVYRSPDKYLETSDWLAHWAYSKAKSFASPSPPDFIQKAYTDSQKPAPAALQAK